MTVAPLPHETVKPGRPAPTVGRRPELRPGRRRSHIHPAAVTKVCTRCGLERGELCFGRLPDGSRRDVCRDCRPTTRGGA